MRARHTRLCNSCVRRTYSRVWGTRVREEMVCAGRSVCLLSSCSELCCSPGRDSCTGDSGGPLLLCSTAGCRQVLSTGLPQLYS